MHFKYIMLFVCACVLSTDCYFVWWCTPFVQNVPTCQCVKGCMLYPHLLPHHPHHLKKVGGNHLCNIKQIWMPSHSMGRSFTTQGVAIFAIKVLHSSHPCPVCKDSGENNGVCTQHTLNLRSSRHICPHHICVIHHTLAFQMSGRLLLRQMGLRKESSLTTAACPYAWHPGGSLLNGTKDQWL